MSPVDGISNCSLEIVFPFFLNEFVANLVAYLGGRSSRNLMVTFPLDAPNLCNCERSRDLTFDVAIK